MRVADTLTTQSARYQLGQPAVWTDASTVRWGRFLVAFIVSAWSLSFLLGFTPALALVTGAGFILAVVGVVRPELGLLGVGILSTLDAPARALLFTGGVLRWNTFSYWLLIIVVLYLPLTIAWRDVQTWLLRSLVLVLGIWLIISPDPWNGIQHLLGAASAFGLMVYFYRVRHDRILLHWLGIVCGTLSALGGVAYFMSKSTLPDFNPNALVFFPLTGLFTICLSYPSTATSRWTGGALYLVAASNLGLVFLTGSRGGILVGAFCAVFLLLTTRHVRSGLQLACTAALLGVGLATQFVDLREGAMHKITKMLDPSYSLTERTNGRYDLAVAAVLIFREHPLGVGTGGVAIRWGELDRAPELSSFRRGRQMQAHSAWTKTLAENGVVGLALLAAYVLSFAVTGAGRSNRAARAFGLLAAAVLAVAFLSTEFQAKGLWLLAAGVTVLLQYQDSSTPRDHVRASRR